MSNNFNWNTIPGMNASLNGTNGTTNDHFDDYFNDQLMRAHHNANSTALLPTLGIDKSQEQVVPAPKAVQTPSTDFNKLRALAQSETQLATALGSLKINVTRSHSVDTLNTIKSNKSGTEDSGLNRIIENPTHSSSTDTLIADNENSIPLSLTINDMSPRELKTYLRWYENIQERKNTSKIVTIDDVFLFLQNFKIPEAIKERMRSSFFKWANSLNIGQFFALMRLLAHALHGKPLTRSLIRVPAPIPSPIPILCRKRKTSPADTNEKSNKTGLHDTKKKLDIDSFTEFLLTGERPSAEPIKSTSNKKVKFSEVLTFSPSPVTEDQVQQLAASINNPSQQHVLDFSLPMNQLLDKLRGVDQPSSNNVAQSNPQPSFLPTASAQTENEEEELKDVNIDTFKNITQKALQNAGDNLEALKPNLTGSASKSMKEQFMHQFEQTFNYNNQSNSFNTPSSNILSLAANNTVVSPILDPVNNTKSMQTLFVAEPLIPASKTQSFQQFTQTPPVLEYTEVTQVNQDESQDYFGFVPNAPQLTNNYYNSNNNVLQPPVPPPSRSRASSSASPPPVPPPPRSRKLSAASTTTISTIPPPTPGNSHPVLPPKPLLNAKQKKHFLSLSDEVGQSLPTVYNQSYNQFNMNNTSNMNMGMNNLNGLNGLNNVHQVNQLNQLNQQLTQMPQLSNMGNNSNMNLQGVHNYNMNGSASPSGIYGQQQPNITQYQSQTRFVSPQSGGGRPSRQQPQQQQQQQQPSHPLQGQPVNWSGWNV